MMIKVGILGCADIAFRRFLPSIKQVEGIEAVAVAEEYDKEKLPRFCEEYGLEAEESFSALMSRQDIDALYIPQPPALHYPWARKALELGKHVLLEKPSTMAYDDSKNLVELAGEKGVALQENYMFQYHSQIAAIKGMLSDRVIGDIRFLRAVFCFPRRLRNDFRYSREMGGGALLDAGGYPVKLAAMLLGNQLRVKTAKLHRLMEFDVDMYGEAVLENAAGKQIHIGFGMDCFYQCCLEALGSRGRLYTNRIFTAPDGYRPTITLEKADKTEQIELEGDAAFQRSIERFLRGIHKEGDRGSMYEEILVQAKLIDSIRELGIGESK